MRHRIVFAGHERGRHAARAHLHFETLILEGLGMLLVKIAALVENHLFDDAKAGDHGLLGLIDHKEELTPQDDQRYKHCRHDDQGLAVAGKELAGLLAIVRPWRPGGALLLLIKVVHG